MKLLGSAVASTLLVVGLFVAPTAAAVSATAAADTGPYTSWTMRGDPGDGVVGDHDYSYDASSGITVSGDAHTVNLSVANWSLDVDAPGADVLTAGQSYPGAMRYPFNNGAPGLDLDGASGCNTITGTFSIQELTTDASGQVASIRLTFEQHCDGDPAAYGSIAWRATQPAAGLPPVLDLHLDRDKVVYGTAVAVDVQISADSAVRQVGIYITPDGGSAALVSSVTVDTSGHARLRVKPGRSGTISAVLAGAGQFPDRTAAQAVTVRARVVEAVRNARGHRGRYRLFPESRDALILGVVQPLHPGECLEFQIELRVRGSWTGHDSTLPCVHLDKHGVAAVRIPHDRRLQAIPVRVRAHWRGNRDDPSATSRWDYLEFVR